MKKKTAYSIKYPRRVLVRRSMTALGKLLLTLLADVEIHGKERLPKNGPLILAGNHAAVLEAVLLAVYTPGVVEFIGNGDIPFDPNYAFIPNAYGLVPINRGNLDRQGLKMGLGVLTQGGLLGIFPEGGIWDPAQMQAQIGVAWLSYRAQAPILPVGFGGVRGGLQKALNLKHPKFVMNVGELIPPVVQKKSSLSMKDALTQASKHILSEINALIPSEDLAFLQRRAKEKFSLKIEVIDEVDRVTIPESLRVQHGTAYARFLYNPTLIDVLIRNLRLPIKPLKQIDFQTDLSPVINAWDSILSYLETNPGYFTYRFGVEQGLAVKTALLELRQLAEWAAEARYAISVVPVRRYRNANTNALVIERGGCFPDSM